MARFTYRTCKCCSKLHELGEWPEACLGHFGEAARQGPQIISDTIEPFRHMATGEMFDSKSRYRADLKTRGFVEVGNENVQQRRVELPRARDDLRRARSQLGG